jgi:hypothetical protein
MRLEELRQSKKSNDLIGERNRNLPACIIMPKPTTLQRAPAQSILQAVGYDDVDWVFIGAALNITP